MHYRRINIPKKRARTKVKGKIEKFPFDLLQIVPLECLIVVDFSSVNGACYHKRKIVFLHWQLQRLVDTAARLALIVFAH